MAMVALWIALGLLVILTWLVLPGVRWARYVKFLLHDAQAAKSSGCRVCGAPAVRATWHPAPGRRRWSLRNVAFGWCERHYEDVVVKAQRSRRAS
jgi:hypothetical protein